MNMTLRAAALMLCLGIGTSSVVKAQAVSIRPELGAQLTYWQLEDGYGRVGPTVHLGVFRPKGTPIALRLSGSYAPRGDLAPGILVFGGQAAIPLFGARPADSRRVGLELVMGFGGLHFDGSTGAELENPCGPDGCFEGGVFFHEGWAQVLEVGFGLEIPVGSKLFAYPGAALLIPVGDSQGGPGHRVLRAGLGLGWR
jgi:hypothetical protein